MDFAQKGDLHYEKGGKKVKHKNPTLSLNHMTMRIYGLCFTFSLGFNCPLHWFLNI